MRWRRILKEANRSFTSQGFVQEDRRILNILFLFLTLISTLFCARGLLANAISIEDALILNADPSNAEGNGEMGLWAGRTWPACRINPQKTCKDSTWAVLIRQSRRNWAFVSLAAPRIITFRCFFSHPKKRAKKNIGKYHQPHY